MQNFLNKVIKTSVYLLVFFLPLFFLPFSFEAFEFNKQYLLFFLVTIAGLAWLARMVIYDKELRFRKTSLDIFVLAFIVVGIFSAIFSLDKSSSLYGFYGRFSDGLIGLLSMGLLYFLITNNVGVGEDNKLLSIGRMLKVFLWSSGVVMVGAYLSVFGILARLGQLISMPSVITQVTFNTASGSLEGLTIFLAIVVSLVVGLMTSAKTESKKTTWGYWFLIAGSLIMMLIVDFTMSWIVLLASLVLFVGFSLWKRIFRDDVNKLLIPIFLVIVAAVAIPINPSRLVFGNNSSLANLPQEQVLNQNYSWNVSFDAATANVKNGFLGSGMGTFFQDFAQYKPVQINNSWMWQIRFDRAGDYFAGILATMGFAGLASYVVLIGLFLIMGCLLMIGINNISEAYPFQVALLMAFIALLAAQIVYYQNTVLAFAFWMILGLSMVSWRKPIKEKVISFKDFPELSLVLSTVVIIVFVALLAVYFFAVKFYIADVNYNDALNASSMQQSSNYLTSAVTLNPYSARYRVALSDSYLYQALQDMSKPANEQSSSTIQVLIAQSINQAQNATKLQKNQVANWENLGTVYEQLVGVASGAADWGISSFKTASAYEPTNPVLYTEIGKLYEAKGDATTSKQYFQKAISVKADYSDAVIQMALLLENEHVTDKAISDLENLVTNDPLNAEARFQLGRLYFNNKEVDKAITQFKAAIVLAPQDSNAHYSLGIAYASQGNTADALSQFEEVLKLNPGNQDVIQKIDQLKGSSQQNSTSTSSGTGQ